MPRSEFTERVVRDTLDVTAAATAAERPIDRLAAYNRADLDKLATYAAPGQLR